MYVIYAFKTSSDDVERCSSKPNVRGRKMSNVNVVTGMFVVAFLPISVLMIPALILVGIIRYRDYLKDVPILGLVRKTIAGRYGNGLIRRFRLLVLTGSRETANYVQEQVNFNISMGTTDTLGKNYVRLYEYKEENE